MVEIHNIKSKKDELYGISKLSTKDKILKFLLSNKDKEFSIREISKKIDVDYKGVYLIINKLIGMKTVNSKKIGQTILCSINLRKFNDDIFKVEYIRRKELLKNKDIFSLQSYFDEIKEPFFILLVFGSYASGKQVKNSDIDLMLISDNNEIRKQIKNKISLIPLDIHLIEFSSKEFLSMLKTTDLNVGGEVFNNNIILFGIEDYYRLIENA